MTNKHIELVKKWRADTNKNNKNRLLKSNCTPEQWAIEVAKRLEREQTRGSADLPIPGAAKWLSKSWLKLKPNPRAREFVKPYLYTSGF